MKTPVPQVILASASPRRSDLLRRIFSEFKIVPSRAQELDDPAFTATELCRLNAWRKARDVSENYPDSLVIGADTLVTRQNRVFGKPGSLEEAATMLLELQGKEHFVITGVSLIHRATGRVVVFSEASKVRFRKLSRAQIRDYHLQVNPLDKAGAYGLQGQGGEIVSYVHGSKSNVIGLPMEKLCRVLAERFEDVLHRGANSNVTSVL